MVDIDAVIENMKVLAHLVDGRLYLSEPVPNGLVGLLVPDVMDRVSHGHRTNMIPHFCFSLNHLSGREIC